MKAFVAMTLLSSALGFYDFKDYEGSDIKRPAENPWNYMSDNEKAYWNDRVRTAYDSPML